MCREGHVKMQGSENFVACVRLLAARTTLSCAPMFCTCEQAAALLYRNLIGHFSMLDLDHLTLSLIAADRRTTTNRQSSNTSHQPPTTNHQPLPSPRIQIHITRPSPNYRYTHRLSYHSLLANCLSSAATMPSPTPSQPREQTPCRLLELPAELRNHIYELAFTTDYEDNEKIDLIAANPPNKELLLACRQIYNEAAQIYNASYRDFFKTRNFYLKYEDPVSSSSPVEQLNDSALENVVNLEIRLPGGRTLRMLEKPGEWQQSHPGTSPKKYLRFGSDRDGAIGFECHGSADALKAARGKDLTQHTSLKESLLKTFCRRSS